ncbi:MAG: flavin reductase family protein [Clostridia bacterium]|jgi:flavin reductase (DIM6/NTAB) family NADH-FMN oxidoreductase RutF|nr:flavin reductase family protein [Clostridia bacterium]MCI2000669.1 flavin reductase family protein [Clostridia bacterium]MCI2015258.1 flavin reductase family protein [Clostridia bacterium]
MKEISAFELDKNVFEMIGKDWLLVTAEKDGRVNTMTASWGSAGIMWGNPTAFIFIRPQRFTKTFIDNSEFFSLSVPGDEYRKALNYCGTVSGRDEDKIQGSGLTLEHVDGVPYFKEGKIVLICKKLFAQELKEESFLDKSVIDKWYPSKDFHTMYAAEIVKVLIQN